MVDVKPTTYILIPSNLNWTVIYYRRKTYHAGSQPGEANKKLKNSLKIQGYLKHTEFILVFHLFIHIWNFKISTKEKKRHYGSVR